MADNNFGYVISDEWWILWTSQEAVGSWELYFLNVFIYSEKVLTPDFVYYS